MQKETYVIGLDLGGTNSVFGITDSNGNILAKTIVKTQNYPDVDIYVDECINAIDELIRKTKTENKIQSMGIGAPNANYYTGQIEDAVNLPWKGNVPLTELFNKKLGIPVFATNDANAAALGEMYYGKAKNMSNFIMLTLGTGVGSGIVVNRQMVYGSHGQAGELGHITVNINEEKRKCGCGRFNCLETFCSATGIVETAKRFIRNNEGHSLLKETDLNELTAKDIAKAAEREDEMALKIFEYTGEILGKACADFATFIDPEAFIFFGGLAKAGHLLMNPTIKSFKANAMNRYKNSVRFLISELNDADAAILGASAIGMSRQTVHLPLNSLHRLEKACDIE